MNQKQIKYAKIGLFITMVAVVIIFVVKGYNVKETEPIVWLQWIFSASLIILIGFNYIVFNLLKIYYIYWKRYLYSEKKLKILLKNLILYLFTSVVLQMVFLMILIMGYTDPQSIGIKANHDMNIAIFIVFLIYISLSICLTISRGITKYFWKKKTIKEKYVKK